MNESEIQELIDKAIACDHDSNLILVEAVGNDDAINTAFLNLINTARHDRSEVGDDEISNKIRKARNDARLHVFHQLALAVDSYLEELGDE